MTLTTKLRLENAALREIVNQLSPEELRSLMDRAREKGGKGFSAEAVRVITNNIQTKSLVD